MLNVDAGFRLQIDQSGRFDGLTVRSAERVAPDADQVEVRVVLAGLNVSDVLKVKGLDPSAHEHGPAIGSECVGVVTAIGEDVHSVQIGQRVLALGSGSFGSHLTTLEDLVVAVPDALTDRQAATFGVAYLTAWHALQEVARLEPGERVLIHSAAGGVGLASVSIAKMIGAHVYATAGSADKREMLSAMGFDYIGDSHSLAFADEIANITDGEGVDVVVNTLEGQALTAGLKILAPGGRFIELGKRAVQSNATLGLRALARSGTFAVVDIDLNLRRRPWHYRQLLDDILIRAVRGDLAPLPVTEFRFDHAVDAFRLMGSGTHTGKILIAVPQGRGVGGAVPAPHLVA